MMQAVLRLVVTVFHSFLFATREQRKIFLQEHAKCAIADNRIIIAAAPIFFHNFSDVDVEKFNGLLGRSNSECSEASC